MWGILTMVVSLALQAFGVDVDVTSAADGVTLSEGLLIVGMVLSALGARFATRPVTIFGKTFGADLAANPAAQIPTKDA